MAYDAFISYSHAAGDLLAPRLQAGLQRFAKPWWKRRAIHVFRDESSLSANPHLWSSITGALDESEWFVLLLSPDAAASPWVNDEVAYWLEYKTADRILPVVTDGEFGSQVFPPALSFDYEPRWVDLRFARNEDQLDLKNPRFSAAVADIASAVRGIPKDELESEEVRQHRRTVRTAWAAAVALGLLVVLAGGLALRASRLAASEENARKDAETNAATAVAAQQDAEAARDDAQNERNAAQDERDRADAAAGAARAAEADAVSAAIRAQSEAMAASALVALEEDPELSVLLGIQALMLGENVRTKSALHESLQAHRSIYSVAWDSSRTLFGILDGSLSPEGDLLAVTGLSNELEIWETSAAATPLWTFSHISSGVLIDAPQFSVDGSIVYVVITWDKDLAAEGETQPTDQRFGLFGFDALTGEEQSYTALPECMFFEVLNPQPRIDPATTLYTLRWVPLDSGCDQGMLEFGSFDVETGQFSPIATVRRRMTGNVPTVSADGTRAAIGSGGPGRVIDLRSGDVVFSFDGGASTISADGSLVLVGQNPLELWEVDTGLKINVYAGNYAHASFNADESIIIAGGFDGSTYLIDVATGEHIFRIRGQGGRDVRAVLSDDGSRLATFSADASVRVWYVGSRLQAESVEYTFDQGAESVYIAAGVSFAEDVGLARFWDPDGGTSRVFDRESGEIIEVLPGVSSALSPDGAVVAIQPVLDNVTLSDAETARGAGGRYQRFGQIELRDSHTGHVLRTLEGLCEWFNGIDEFDTPECEADPDEYGDYAWDLEFSPDGQFLAMAGSRTHGLTIWNTSTGERVWFSGDLWTRQQPGLWTYPQVAWSPDGAVVATITEQLDGVLVFDTQSWEQIAALPQEQLFNQLRFSDDGEYLIGGDWLASVVVIETETWTQLPSLVGSQQGGSLSDVDIDPSGTLLATSGSDGVVRIWDISTSSVVQEISFDGGELQNVEFLGQDRVLVTARFDGPAVVVVLDTTELLAVAKRRITRGFTEQECATYGIDPCLTLEQIRAG